MKPSDDPRANELRNKNITAQHDQLPNRVTAPRNQNEGNLPSERRNTNEV